MRLRRSQNFRRTSNNYLLISFFTYLLNCLHIHLLTAYLVVTYLHLFRSSPGLPCDTTPRTGGPPLRSPPARTGLTGAARTAPTAAAAALPAPPIPLSILGEPKDPDRRRRAATGGHSAAPWFLGNLPGPPPGEHTFSSCGGEQAGGQARARAGGSTTASRGRTT